VKRVVAVLVVALIPASIFAIWPVVARAPWESGPSGGGQQSEDAGSGSPVSTRLEVENAVRGCFSSEQRPRIERVDSEFLGDNTWEVRVEFRPNLEIPSLVAVFRVLDGTLSVQPLNNWADRYGCSR
jgi:hypothetical protein